MRKVLSRLFSKLRRDIRGNVLIVTAIGAASTVGAAGLGVDTIQWFLAKRQLQQAADSGALAGAMSLYKGASMVGSVRNSIDRNFVEAVTEERIVSPPAVGAYAGDASAVEVLISVSRKLPFSSIFLSSSPIIRTRAVATAVAVGEPCVIATATDGIGIDVFGTADVDLDCPVASNSPDGVSIDAGGTSYLDTNLVLSVGGIDYGAGNIPGDAAVVSYGLPVDDPLAGKGLATPSSPSACTYNNFNVTPSATRTMVPGRYCNGVMLQGDVTMLPGLYIMDRGSFTVTASANIIGEGVTIILTGSSSSNVATLSINGAAELDLRAPTAAEAAISPISDPKWAGILFYQDPLGDEPLHTINGGADINLEGIIYMPTGNLTYNGDATQAAQCLLLISERIRFGGTNHIANNCNDEIDANIGTANVIRVVE